MTTVISGSSPSITFSDATTQTTAFTSTPSVTSITTSADATINGLTVGLGAGSVSNNTVLGVTALASNTTGARNVAIGQSAFTNNLTATNTVAIGYNSAINIRGGSNVSLGAYSLYGSVTPANNTATNCVAIGFNTMSAITSGSYNVGIGGAETLTSNTSGSYNVGVGAGALQANTVSNNTAVGYQALYANTTAGKNTAVGYAAGSGQTTGSGGDFGENVFIGYAAGSNSVTGSDCVYIGSNCKASGTGVNYEFVIAQYLTGKGTGTFYVGGANGAYNQANSATWSVTSDQRLKKNIVDNTIGLEAINGIRVRNFEYRTKDEVTELPLHTVIEKKGVQLGVIAQELKEILPDCVTEQSTGVLSVDSDNIMWHMINAIKELSAKVTALENK
jgi:hypothetical protein